MDEQGSGQAYSKHQTTHGRVLFPITQGLQLHHMFIFCFSGHIIMWVSHDLSNTILLLLLQVYNPNKPTQRSRHPLPPRPQLPFRPLPQADRRVKTTAAALILDLEKRLSSWGGFLKSDKCIL